MTFERAREQAEIAQLHAEDAYDAACEATDKIQDAGQLVTKCNRFSCCVFDNN